MRRYRRLLAAAAATVGALLVAIGIVYLTVACENLPGVLGPHPGDTSPRTPLGIAGVVLGLAGFAVAMATLRRRPPSAPVQP